MIENQARRPVGVTVRVPAKVNLHLGVGAAGADGFHELATVFQAVSLYDTVTATPDDELRITVSGQDAGRVPLGAGNLAAVAALRVARRLGVRPAVHLHLTKRIPVAGGMAGGSADAAAALLACAALWDADFEPGRTPDWLAETAAAIGSDVPFALLGGTALGTGRGERLTPVPAAGSFYWVFAVAHSGLGTPEVFAEHDRLPDRLHDRPGGRRHPAAGRLPAPPAAGLYAALAAGDPGRLAGHLRNDLHRAALSLRPDLAVTLRAGHEAGALGALLSGSGPTCAFLAKDATAAGELAAALTASGNCRAVHIAHGPVGGAALVPADGDPGQGRQLISEGAA